MNTSQGLDQLDLGFTKGRRELAEKLLTDKMNRLKGEASNGVKRFVKR